MANMRFRDRPDAGRRLAPLLDAYAGHDVVVLALPRGGVPVAAEVAERLNAELDVLLVRKLGLPGHEELAMGAIASGGAMVLNDDLLSQLPVDDAVIDRVRAAEQQELERRDQAYRGDRPMPQLEDREVIIVDDGLATGATMRAAVSALRQYRPRRIVVAVPVAPPETVRELEQEADQVVSLLTPTPFYGVGYWFEDFSQTTDDEVRSLLRHGHHQQQPGAGRTR
jgi:putative phosphoribosyl transferase